MIVQYLRTVSMSETIFGRGWSLVKAIESEQCKKARIKLAMQSEFVTTIVGVI